jgi:hypothetical protein
MQAYGRVEVWLTSAFSIEVNPKQNYLPDYEEWAMKDHGPSRARNITLSDY